MAGAIGFACTGALAAGLLDGASVPLRMAAALIGLVVAPAVTTSRCWARVVGGREWLGVVLPASVIGVLSVHALIAATFTLLHASFALYSTCTLWLSLAWCGGVVVRGLRRARVDAGEVSPIPWRRVLVITLVLSAFAAAVPPHYAGGEDAYDHIGYVRRIIAYDDMRPDGVLALPEDAAALPADARKGAFHDLVAACADVGGVDAVEAWGLVRLLMYPLSVLAFAGFSGAFVRGGALIACMALFFVSYPGTTFHLINTAAYGQNLAAVWYWLLAALTLRGFGARARSGLLLTALACAGVVIHLGVAVHALLLAVALAAFAPWLGLVRRDASRMALCMSAGVVLGWLLRGAHGSGEPNEIHAHVQGAMSVVQGALVVSPFEILRQYGLVFLGGLATLPLLLVAARHDLRARRVLAMTALPVLLAFLPPLSTFLIHRASYMSMRALLNIPALAGAVLATVWLVRTARARGVPARLVAAVFLAFVLLRFLDPSLRAFGRDLHRAAGGSAPERPDRMSLVVSGLPVGATVLSDPVTAYRLSAYSSHHFVAILQQHANPLDPFALDRLEATRDVLSPYALPQLAVQACRRYHVDFVVLSQRPPGVSTAYLTPSYPALYTESLARLKSMPASFREFVHGDGFEVLSFDPRPVWSNDFAPPTPPVVPEAIAVDTCSVPVPHLRFETTGVRILQRVVAPGDSLHIAFEYRRGRGAGYGPGILFHVRFDHESLADGPSFAGEKCLRRWRERAGGTLFRFRADLRAGHGVYEPDLWPMGIPLVERFRVRVPSNAAPGRYRVEVRAVEETLLPNFELRDLFFNRDHYSGIACASIEVRAAEASP